MRGVSCSRAVRAGRLLVALWIACGSVSEAAADGETGARPPLVGWRALEASRDGDAASWRCWRDGAAGRWAVARGAAGIEVRPASRPAPVDSSVRIPDTAAFAGPRVLLERSDGVWLGIDRGEFGGGLWWLPRSGASPVAVSQENVRGIVMVDGAVTAISGLAHMGWNQGALLQPERTAAGSWRLGRVIPLGAAPQAYTVERTTEGEALWIATYAGVTRFTDGRVRRVHDLDGWPLIDSIAVAPDGEIFLGLRGGVGRLTPARRGYHEAWLVPPRCSEIAPETCECRAARAPTETDEWPTTKP